MIVILSLPAGRQGTKNLLIRIVCLTWDAFPKNRDRLFLSMTGHKIFKIGHYLVEAGSCQNVKVY